jgi:hypothetical protein
MSNLVNKAYATFTILNNKRAIVDMDYQFTDGRENHTGFSTVEVMRGSDLYDKCYARAEALAETQGCRLETFKNSGGKFTIYYTNFGYADDRTFDELDGAIAHATRNGFEATISHTGRPVGSWSPIRGYSDLTS